MRTVQILDHLQNSFGRELNVTPENAFIDFNFAPLHLRRDVGSLGLLFKVNRGIAHQKLSSLSRRHCPENITPKLSASIPNSHFLLWSSFRFDESIDAWDCVRLEQMTETFGGSAVRFRISKSIDGVRSQPLPAVNGSMIALFQWAARVTAIVVHQAMVVGERQAMV